LEARERSVEYYLLPSGPPSPFGAWRDRVPNKQARAAIDARVARLRAGNFGDSEPVGSGASESRIHLGPGFRIYYGVAGAKIILLCGGDKSSQPADIKKAKNYWADYKERVEKNAQKFRLQKRSSRGSEKR
jgi:putative addiction module killer protein